MENANKNANADAVREGAPPLIPNSRRATNQDLPAESSKSWILKRLWPVGLGGLVSAWTATSQIPESISVVDRLCVFGAMMAGPFCAPILLNTTDFSHSPIANWQTLGVLSIALIVAYPVKQSTGTACVSIVGLAFWFWAGFISVIYCYYAG